MPNVQLFQTQNTKEHENSQEASRASSTLTMASESAAVDRRSLRLRRLEIKNDVQRKKRINHVWPRTVEVATDPSVDESGENKLRFLLAINLYPKKRDMATSNDKQEDERTTPPERYFSKVESTETRCSAPNSDVTAYGMTQKSTKIDCVELSSSPTDERYSERRAPREEWEHFPIVCCRGNIVSPIEV